MSIFFKIKSATEKSAALLHSFFVNEAMFDAVLESDGNHPTIIRVDVVDDRGQEALGDRGVNRADVLLIVEVAILHQQDFFDGSADEGP